MLAGLQSLNGAPVALFLDVDGTILDISASPGKVRVPPGLPRVLEMVSRALDGAFAFVSGRSIGDLDRLFAPRRFPAAGQHGAEIRYAGGPDAVTPQVETIDGAVLRQIEGAASVHPGIEVENKGSTIAVHYRRAPAAGAGLEDTLRVAVAGGGKRLALIPGNMVWEIRDRRYSKATAVRALMRRKPFRGRVPVFVGDDVSDEDGFTEVESLGGLALPVGDVHSPRRRTAFAAPSDVRAWLASLPVHLTAEAQP